MLKAVTAPDRTSAVTQDKIGDIANALIKSDSPEKRTAALSHFNDPELHLTDTALTRLAAPLLEVILAADQEETAVMHKASFYLLNDSEVAAQLILAAANDIARPAIENNSPFSRSGEKVSTPQESQQLLRTVVLLVEILGNAGGVHFNSQEQTLTPTTKNRMHGFGRELGEALGHRAANDLTPKCSEDETLNAVFTGCKILAANGAYDGCSINDFLSKHTLSTEEYGQA